jgi:hypothetical protein
MPVLDLLGGSEVSMARRYRLFPLLLRAIGAPQRARDEPQSLADAD